MAGSRGPPVLFLLGSLVLFLNAATYFAQRKTGGDAFATPLTADSRHGLVRRGVGATSSPQWLIAASDVDHKYADTNTGGKSKCDGVHLQPDQCGFVRQNCAGLVTGVFNYMEFYYCSAAPWMIPLVALICWLLILFALVGIAASEFFCPNLSTIARSLRMSENMAGVSFLAFGNGSPDLFSTFSALSADSGGLALGELVGAASFILNVVVGAMAVITPFQVAAYPFFRDLFFFVGAVSFVVYTVWDQRITLGEGIILIAYYLLYVAIVVAGGWLRQRYAKRHGPLMAPSEAESPVLTAHDDEQNQYGDDIYYEYSENQPLLGKTPTSEHPRLLGRPSTTHEVGSSLMFRKKIQHHRRKSFLGAFEFRDAMQSWKTYNPRSTAFSDVGDLSPVLPGPSRIHRRERSNASFDPARGRVVERPVLYRSSTYSCDNSAGSPPSIVGMPALSRSESPFLSSSSLLREESDQCLLETDSREQKDASSQMPAPDKVPDQIPRSVPSIVVTTAPHGRSNPGLLIDTSALPRGHSIPPSTLTGKPGANSETPGGEMPPSIPTRLVLLQTPTVPQENVVATDYFSGSHAAPVEEEVDGRQSTRTPGATTVRRLINTLFPHLSDWPYRSLSSKIAGLVATPLFLLLIITVPVVEEDEEDKLPPGKGADLQQEQSPCERTVSHSGTEITVIDVDDAPQEMHACRWNRWLATAQLAIAPPFFSSVLFAINPSLPSSMVPIGIVVGAVCSTLCYTLTSARSPPPWHRNLCFVGFAAAIIWIYFVANEVVGLLQAFGLILGLSEAIVGLTIFAMGNSLGDFVANVTIARMGFPVMAISACFGGPLLNILLGIGLSSTYLTASTGTAYRLNDLSPTIFLSCFVLLVSLLSSLVLVPLTGFRLTRSYGYYLITLYAVGMVINVSTEIYLSK